MKSIIERTLDLAITIQQIPAPTFAEDKREAFVRNQFLTEGLCDIVTDQIGNVYGRLPGKETARPLVLSAHMDTVFPTETDLLVTRKPDKIYGPGIGDNATAVAGLLGLLWVLRDQNITLPGDLWLVANVCEEGLGNLLGMKAIVDRFDDTPLAYIILEGMALGQVYHRALWVRRYRITVKTEGGHSWADSGILSANHELATLITKLANIPLPNKPRTTLNVGVINGGISINSIASQASLDLDLRSEGMQSLDDLARRVETLVEQANQVGIHVDSEAIGDRPAGETPPNHPLVQLGVRCLDAQGVRSHLNIGSTDANIPLSRGLPAICIGLTTGGRAHTTAEYINTSPLEKGLSQLVALVEGVFDVLG